MTAEQARKVVERHVAALAEHFPNVQIMVSRVIEDGNTESFRLGSGDWYARRGMAHEFIDTDMARTYAYAVKEENE